MRTFTRHLPGIAFVLVVSFILQLGSERAYWMYSTRWFTTDVFATLEVTVVYAFAVAATMWAFTRARWSGVHQVILAAALFGWLVEGVITPVIYEGGLFFLPFLGMFAGWHGAVAFVGFWYLPRRFGVERHPGRLTVASAIFGGVWGTWAVTAWLPESDQVAEWTPSAIWPVRTEPLEFALFSLLLVLLLMVAHVAQDRVWPAPGFRPGRGALACSLGLLTVFAVPTLLAVPWAPIVLVPVVAATVRWLWRDGTEGPTPLDALGGRLHVPTLIGLAPLALVPAAIYWAAWELDPSPEVLEIWRATHVGLQIVSGLGMVGWAIARATRTVGAPSASEDAEGVGGESVRASPAD